MDEGTATPEETSQEMMAQQALRYKDVEEKQALLDWLVANPSVPLSLRRQFHALWEIVPFGNYTEKDIQRLLIKFREWCILFLWYIPDDEWDRIRRFESDDATGDIEMDTSLLLNTLEQLFYIQLTRGREGFTVKEINTSRVGIAKPESEKPKKRAWWF